MNRHLTVRAGAAAALTLTALAAVVPMAAADEGPGRNQQVALVDRTDEQPAFESDVNGTAQVTSDDGNHVVFSTAAPLVPSDDNDLDDVYLRDIAAGTTVLVSQRGGTPGNDYSFEPTISADGRMVAFTTWATNLTRRRDRNGSALDVVVKDLQTGRLQRVSVTTAGFQREQNSFSPVISGNGRFVSFQSFGSFDARDDDRREDVYVRNLATGTTQQVSLTAGGRDIPASVLNGDVSFNGRRIVFGHDNALWVRFLKQDATLRVWHEPNGPDCQPMPAGSLGRPSISGNGLFVAFSSCAGDLPGEDEAATDIYRFELASGAIVRVHARGDGNSYSPSLSFDGSRVGFGSEATDLVASDDEGMPDVFVADVDERTVVRASEGPDGAGGDSWNGTTGVAISGDGHTLAYSSYADNLVDGDAFDLREVFVWRQ